MNGETDLDQGYAKQSSSMNQPNTYHHERRPDERNRTPPLRRERSLSPYSKRIALTQAMNMGR